MIDKLYQEMISIKMKTTLEVRKLTNQFQEFKNKNNLDEYFEKYLTDETRKNTLKLVDDLMVEEDWMEKLMEYKAFLDKLQYSDTESKLQTFYDDLLASIKGRLVIFAEQNEQVEQTIDEFMKTPQMPVNIFKYEMEKTLD